MSLFDQFQSEYLDKEVPVKLPNQPSAKEIGPFFQERVQDVLNEALRGYNIPDVDEIIKAVDPGVWEGKTKAGHGSITTRLGAELNRRKVDKRTAELSVMFVGRNISDFSLPSRNVTLYLIAYSAAWWRQKDFAQGSSCFFGPQGSYIRRSLDNMPNCLWLTLWRPMSTNSLDKPARANDGINHEHWDDVGRAIMFADTHRKDSLVICNTFGHFDTYLSSIAVRLARQFDVNFKPSMLRRIELDTRGDFYLGGHSAGLIRGEHPWKVFKIGYKRVVEDETK